MDGRDFGAPRSVHVPPPLLAGLGMEPHRLGAAAAAGRIAASPGHLGANHPPPLHSGKFLPSAINLHPHHSDAFPTGSSPFLSGYPGPSSLTSDPAYRSANPSSLQMAQLWASHAHEGYPPLPSSLYSSPYLSLGRLETSSLSQHPLYDPHKDGYFLSSSLSQSPLHPAPASSTTPSSSTPPQRTSRDGGRDRTYRAERERDRDRERERLREDTRPHSVVDLTQEARGEDDRRASRDRERDKDKDHDTDRDRDGWPFHPHQHKSHSHPSTAESRSRLSPPQPSFPPGGGGGEGRFPGSEKDRRGREEEGGPRSHHGQNPNNPSSHSERQRRNECVAATAGSLHVSYVLPPALQPSSAGPAHLAAPREPVREQRVSAPTYVPSVEVYDERVGPIQIASQARDNKHRDRELERDRDRERESYRFHEKSLLDHPRPSQASDASSQREEGSVICSNGSLGKRSQDASFSSSRSCFSPETRDPSKHALRGAVEPKWNAMSPSANYATNHMAALAAQHGHGLSAPHSQPPQTQKCSSPHTAHRPSSSHSSHGLSPQTHGHGRPADEGSQRRYPDQPGPYRPAGPLVGAPGGGEHPDSAEVSAMQSLIKYSGNFAAEGSASSRHIIDGRGPFGGLGHIGTAAEREKERQRERDKERVAGAMRVPPQLKREQERPDSARSFGREGDGEVRHPPVGIAVAVARQRDSGSSGKQTSGSSDTQRPLLQTAIKDEDRGEDRARHHDDRLLAGRLEREQEKVIRDSKNLPEFTQMHPVPLSSGLTPSMMTPSLMTPNLMVTGGAALAGAGRWPPDPSTLTSHPWMPRPGAPPVWLSSSPYGLAPTPLHQTLPPGYPPSLPGSMPPPYQFARDPQSGQLIVFPTEHLPHYGGDVLERGAPVWSYGPGSSLQHAAQLQLLSQHQILRQQELFMIQQHTAQVLELQRNAQLVERLKASEHRPEIEDKVEKRHTDSKTRPSSISSPSPSPVLHPRKPPHPSRSPTPSTSSLTPLPPTPSPVATLKSEEGAHRVVSHAPKLLLHPTSPRSASPPPSSPRRPKQEEGEVGVREQRKKSATTPFQGIYSDLPPGYPYQSITAPYGSFPPYHIPASTAENSETHRSCSPAPCAPLTSTHHHSRLLDAEVKPQDLEPLKTGPFLKQPPCEEHPEPELTPEPLSPPLLSRSTDRDREDDEADGRAPKTPSPPPPQGDSLRDVGKEESGEGVIKTEASSNSCQAVEALPVPAEDEPKPELIKEAELAPYRPSISVESDSQEMPPACGSSEQTSVCELEAPDAPSDSFPPCLEESTCEPPVLHPPLPLISSEDPMGGMLALLTASELAQARPATPPIPTLESQVENPPFASDCSSAGSLEMVALEGMALLSQMAKNETELIFQTQDLTLDGLDCLLEASRQILLEAIEKQSHVDLPRTLDPDKKYSWRQRKEEPLYSKMAVDVLDAVEVEYRVRLAELQKTYKEKQRELSKLQRRRDKRERQQQEEERRSLTRRGRGRPRKRKQLPTPTKLDSRPGKAGRTVQYSEDSEAGEGQRKRFRLSRDEDDTETGAGAAKKKKKKKKSWSEQEPPGTHVLEALKAKRGLVCEQEQLASDLDRALSLSQLGSLGAARNLASSAKHEKSKGRCSEGGPKERGLHSAVKGAKLKLAAKASAAEAVRKGKGQKKAVFSPRRPELSSCSNNSDSEEHISSRGGWPPHSGTRPHDSSTRKRRSASSPTSLLPSQKSSRKKHKHLSLLLEEAGLSSSDDSFDQGY